MITDITIYLILAGGAFGLMIAVSILGGLLSNYLFSRNPILYRRLGKISLILYFILVLILGFSLIPVMVKLITDFLVSQMPAIDFLKTIHSAGWYIVYAIWGGYVLGLFIALPAMLKSSFFSSEKPKE